MVYTIKVKLAILFIIFVFPFVLFAQEGSVSTKNEEVKGFVMTIMDKWGEEKAAVAGSKANILQKGLIEIEDVVARIYAEKKGEADTLIHTDKGIYDRLQNIVTSDRFVRINRRDLEVTGTGLEWFPNKSRIVIMENVRVELTFDDDAVEGEDSKGKRDTTIFSEGRGKMDYANHMAVFKKNVVVTDPDVTLKAHAIKIFFKEDSQELERIEAYGNVKIKQPKRESRSRKAVYFADLDQIVLTGNPRIIHGLDFYTADQVTIYDRGEKVVFEPRANLVIYQSTGHEGL